MSIAGSPYRDHPTNSDYARMVTIPKDERCHKCDGLGVIRRRYSSPGSTGKDWAKCFFCGGKGKKKECQ